MRSIISRFWKVHKPLPLENEFNSYRMTESQIVNKYLRNDGDIHQITILAELNAVSREQIIEILRKHGVYVPKRRCNPNQLRIKHQLTDKDKEYILELRDKKTSYRQIAVITGFPIHVVRRVVKRSKSPES